MLNGPLSLYPLLFPAFCLLAWFRLLLWCERMLGGQLAGCLFLAGVWALVVFGVLLALTDAAVGLDAAIVSALLLVVVVVPLTGLHGAHQLVHLHQLWIAPVILVVLWVLIGGGAYLLFTDWNSALPAARLWALLLVTLAPSTLAVMAYLTVAFVVILWWNAASFKRTGRACAVCRNEGGESSGRVEEETEHCDRKWEHYLACPKPPPPAGKS